MSWSAVSAVSVGWTTSSASADVFAAASSASNTWSGSISSLYVEQDYVEDGYVEGNGFADIADATTTWVAA